MQLLDIPINEQQMETTRHGTRGFPMAVYHSVMNRNVLGFINWHWHEELQFCLVTMGNILFYVNERQFLLRRGEGIFINSGYLHMARPEDWPDGAYICLDVNPLLIGGFSGSIMEEKYLTPYLKNPDLMARKLTPAVDWQRNILEGLQQIDFLTGEGKFGYEYKVMELLNQMWLGMITHGIERQKGPESPEAALRYRQNAAAQQILDFIHTHYREKLTLAAIAEAVSFSEGECCRIFKRVTGQTIFEYMQSCRMDQALQLLQSTQLSVSRIAYECGFNSTSYFIESFRKRQGKTPLQYRKQYLSEPLPEFTKF